MEFNKKEKALVLLANLGEENLNYNQIKEVLKEALIIHNVVVTLPSKNSKEFRDWLKTEGYRNKGFGIYQKDSKDYCYTILYKHYCNALEFGN